VPEAARLSPAPVTVARRLGPHPLLAAAGAQQLRAAGARRGDAVVLVMAGSKDPDAATDAVVAGRLLRTHWGAPVEVTFLSGSGRSVPETFDRLRTAGHRRIVASPYLLAPGHFASRAAALARAEGAAVVGDVLAHHPLVAELVVRRYRAAWLGLLGAATPSSPGRASRVA
jgi:sirohydrochlorin ferrochelatase